MKFATTITETAHNWKKESLAEKGTFIEYKLDDGEGGHWNTRIKNLIGNTPVPAVFLEGSKPTHYRLYAITETAFFLLPQKIKDFFIEQWKAQGKGRIEDIQAVYELHCDQGEAQILVNSTPNRFASFTCPGCLTFGTIDVTQYNGMVSIQCPIKGCGYHQTVDFRKREAGA